MRMSDAIALGRTLIEHYPGNVGGCAHGMALASCGLLEKALTGTRDVSTTTLWPWIKDSREFPCGCLSYNSAGGYEQSGRGCIAHLFDQHVFGAKDWSLDRLIDFVRAIEPEEKELNSVEQEEVEYASVT